MIFPSVVLRCRSPFLSDMLRTLGFVQEPYDIHNLTKLQIWYSFGMFA